MVIRARYLFLSYQLFAFSFSCHQLLKLAISPIVSLRHGANLKEGNMSANASGPIYSEFASAC
jgi:hypothetical protein